MISWSDFQMVGNEGAYVQEALDSGWVSGGRFVGDFERSLESVFPASRAFAVSNGTAALQLAYQTLGASPNDEIVVPAFCFQAAANVAIQLGLRPVFCDVDRATWNQSVETVKQACSARTKGIVIVHNYGVAAPSSEICTWAESQGLWVIEDCAEAWFSKNKGRYVGQYGDIATFSMHATKTIASGEGGVVLVNDQSLHERAALIRSHGLARKNKHYYHLLPGNNHRLSNLLCAIALAQFEKRDEILQRQRVHANLYTELLSTHAAIECQVGVGQAADDEVWANAVWIHFDRLDCSRDRLIELLGERGIEVRPGFYAASSLPYIASSTPMHCDNADTLAENIIVLPTAGSVSEAEVRTVCDELIALIDGLEKGA